MNPTLDPMFAAALRNELLAQAAPRPRRTRRRATIIGIAVVGTLIVGGVSAVAGLKPAGDGVGRPLLPPIVVNGVGPADVILPPAPSKAMYVRVELTCYDGTKCNTPGGGVTRPTDDGTPMLQRDAEPLTDQADKQNPQDIPRLDPASGLPIDVTAGTHWRLYVVYTDRLNPAPAPAGDGRTLGLPGNTSLPDFVPIVATNGRSGYVDYSLLTDGAHPTLTDSGTSQPPLPVYDVDGTTVIGTADVSKPYR
jgi:hypothetical protein